MMKLVNGQLVPIGVNSHYNTAPYHEGNGSRASKAVKNYIATHDDSNSYTFDYRDICDIYALSLENMEYNLDIADIIKTAVYAGMCASEWATMPEREAI